MIIYVQSYMNIKYMIICLYSYIGMDHMLDTYTCYHICVIILLLLIYDSSYTGFVLIYE